MWAKGASVVCLGREVGRLPLLSARVPGADSAVAARVSESEVFLQRLYFSATNYFIFIAKLSLPKPLIIQGILPPREDMEIWGVGIHYHTPSVQTDFSGTVIG